MNDKPIRRLWLGMPLVVAVTGCTAISRVDVEPETAARPLGEIDVARICELYHLTDELGDDLWPGFDVRKIPIAINNHDREEMLVGHPDPPPEFHPFAGFELNGRPVMIREGVTYYFGPAGGGWGVELGGEETAYAGVLAPGETTEEYLSVLLHECFHCYQQDYRERADDAYGELPEDDPVFSALLALESRILKAALEAGSLREVRRLAAQFVAVRHERRKDLPEHLILAEGEHEYNEGTATYVQMRMYQLLAERGGIRARCDADRYHGMGGGVPPCHKGGSRGDQRYRGFADADQLYRKELARIRPPRHRQANFTYASYQHGMAQALILDRLRPGWKAEMQEKGMTQFALLERELAVAGEEEERLLVAAGERFAYQDLLAEQEELVAEFLDAVRGFVTAPGRRYRLYHRGIPGMFKWQPQGPVYRVPESVEPEKVPGFHQRRVWAGGIARFEKEGLVFAAAKVPVISGPGFLEWIDSDPAPDRSDLIIEADRQEGEVCFGLQLRSDTFSIQAAKARLAWSEKLVEIHPMPADDPEP